LAPPQNEYDDRQEAVAASVLELVRTLRLATVDVDTDLFGGETRPRPPEQVESVLARADVVVTTRLHGLALALKNGLPAVAIDAVPGGAKVSRQAEAIGWPVVLGASEVTFAALGSALARCLSGEFDSDVERCAAAAHAQGEATRRAFLAFVARSSDRQARAASFGSSRG
jgi:UDP:flavonoid glycosyltransferase YjiC (YdhE family)